MKNKPIYSIIIPHYNIPDLLQRLLDSIPQREDIEIIVVDDNSSSDVVDFNHFPGSDRNDVRIIFDKKGGNGGYARNLGLDVAEGKWLLFADADDFFNYCIRDVLDEYANSSADIVFFKGNSVDTLTYVTAYRTSHLNRFIELHESNAPKSELLLRYMFGEPWCKLIRRSIVKDNNIRFEETSIHNDTAFSYLVGYFSHGIIVDKRALYRVTVRENSVSMEISESKKLERITTFGTSARFFSEHGIAITVTRHFHQLYMCRKEDIETYNKGIERLLYLGFSSKDIEDGIRRERIKQVKQKIKLLIKAILSRLLSRYEVDGVVRMAISHADDNI